MLKLAPDFWTNKQMNQDFYPNLFNYRSQNILLRCLGQCSKLEPQILGFLSSSAGRTGWNNLPENFLRIRHKHRIQVQDSDKGNWTLEAMLTKVFFLRFYIRTLKTPPTENMGETGMKKNVLSVPYHCSCFCKATCTNLECHPVNPSTFQNEIWGS